MASSRKPTKRPSGWGGFLQQAVASVESKLDNILADEDERSTKSSATPAPTKDNLPTARRSRDLSRSNSGARADGRLQERLNRAIAKKTSEGKIDHSTLGVSGGSGVATPTTPDLDSPESKSDLEHVVRGLSDQASQLVIENPTGPTPEQGANDTGHEISIQPLNPSGNALSQSTTRPATPATGSDRNSLDIPLPPSLNGTGSDKPESTKDYSNHVHLQSGEGSNVDLNILRDEIEHEALEKRLQEELLPYVEKIDALQSKLQYLSQEAAQSAQQAAAAAQTGSAEQKMAEKDKKIALLLEEGQTLSKNEIKYLATIKTLRSQAASTTKENHVLKMRAEAAEQRLATMEQRALHAERKLQTSFAEDREVEAIKKERNALASTVAEMKADLARMSARTEAAERRVQTNDAEHLKKQNQELRDELTNVQAEHDLAVKKLKLEVVHLADSLAKEKERFNAMETEMLDEQAALEAKLESLRSRAEESSSAIQGDTQAKLLRQIETLQTQHSVASENWQGIESSLLSRITSTESERDELVKREADLRKKVRDAALKVKRMEQELEKQGGEVQELERKCAEQNQELQHMTLKAQQAEEQLSEVTNALAKQQELMEKEVSNRLAEEKARWTPALHTENTASPVASLRKSSALDLGHLMSPTQSRRPSALSSPYHIDSYISTSQNSTASFRAHASGPLAQTPSIHSVDHDEMFGNGVATSTSPAQTHRGVNDLISTSTIGAGPSVQLVERMSATVRRLETEKTASKDELGRLTAQRDEARSEVVRLMREVEEKRAYEDRVKALEEEQHAINERYQTTLELLGEKSELVEELKADVADVKQMYRDLVESTMK